MNKFYVGYMWTGWVRGKIVDSHSHIYCEFKGEFPTQEELQRINNELLGVHFSGERFNVTFLSIIRLAA